MYTSDLAKLCGDKLCKSAFQKNLANNNNNNNQKRSKTERKKEGGSDDKTSKVVTVRNVTEMNCVWAVVPTARVELKAVQQYFKTAPVITSGVPPSTIQRTVTA